jgi:hypothetical protein
MTRTLFLAALTSAALTADDKRKRQAEILLRVIEAASDPKSPNDAEGLVPAELKKLLTFTRYGLLDSAYIRGGEEEPLRIALAGSLLGFVRFEMEGGLIEYTVRIEGRRSGQEPAPKLLETSVRAKSGESVVLGASRMSGGTKALIVLLQGKLIP